MAEYASVQEMLDALAGEPFASEFAEWKEKTQLSKTLFILRIKSGLTEREVADRLGWTEDDVMKFEVEESGKINFNDFMLYLGAIGLKTNISFVREDTSIVDMVKCHVFETHKLLNQLVEMAGEDEKIAQEVSSFLVDEYLPVVSELCAKTVSLFSRPEDIYKTLEKIGELIPHPKKINQADSQQDILEFSPVSEPNIAQQAR